jgi:hypothetical protein
MQCAACGSSKWYRKRRVKETKTSLSDYDVTDSYVAACVPIQSQCVHCKEWQDEDLPEGWRVRAVCATIYDADDIYVKNYSFKTIARDCNHSRQLIVATLDLMGYPESHYHIKATHSGWPAKQNHAHHYILLDGWQMDKENQQKEKKTMGQKITVKRGKKSEAITPVQGYLYESLTEGPKYIVMALNEERLCGSKTDFRAVVVWADEGAKWQTGKMFPFCSTTGFKLFEGEITLEQP